MADYTNISLSRGAPSLDIIAVDELRAAAQRAFEHDPAGSFAYGTSAGYPRLLEWLANRHDVEPARLLATNGSMQADAFLFEELVEPGDLVVVEAPTYDRTLTSLRKLGADILAIPLEADGIDVGALETALEAGAEPTLAHIIPNFQNPAGCTLSLEKRHRLLELAREYDFLLFEDDPYVELRFAGEQHPRMLELDEGGRIAEADRPGFARRVAQLPAAALELRESFQVGKRECENRRGDGGQAGQPERPPAQSTPQIRHR